MRDLRAKVVLILLAAACNACVSLTYQPRATVGASPDKLPLRVAVSELADSSPPADKRRSFMLGGSAATAPDALAAGLAPSVTDAIIANLSSDDVFEEVSRNPEAPDLVLGGTIRRFYGKARSNPYMLPLMAVTPYIMYLGVPLFESYGTVDVELTLDTPSGQRVASYSAKREFNEWKSMYADPTRGIGTRLNQIFSEAMGDLRGQMLADREKLLQARRAQAAAQ